jgi:Spy/CpxP family protein refolding chaperone
MKKRLILITTIVAIAALAIVPFVYAGPGRHMRSGGHGFGGHGMGFGFMGHVDRIKGELDLSDAQVDQLKTIFRETHEQNAQLREQMHGGFKGVAEKLIANPNDIAGAQALIDQQHAAERVLKTNMLTAASKALNVLTPDQRTKLAGLIEEHGERWGRRKQQ